ncbi:MAG: glycosyltransferase family 4 protein [Planctomycetota bacterium]|jgi:glycosyltransferase involved in cell wall biosynthesis|nr:glycosyltransferase family 4 protein [Planctomycetota bacterium]
MARKKACIFITRLIAGGAQKIVVDLLAHLDRAKYDLHLLVGVTDRSEPHLFDQVPSDVTVTSLDSVVRELSPKNDWIAYRQVKKFLREEAFDILHLHTSKAGVLGSMGGRGAGVPNILYTPHGHIFHKEAAIPGFTELSPLKRQILYRVRKRAYKCCHRLVALSEQDLQEQVELGLAPREQFEVIMNGIDVESFSQGDGEAVRKAFPQFRRFVGSVGRLSREKGHDILIDAFAEVAKEDREVGLFLIGSGSEEEALREQAKRLGISDQVLFTGNLPDVRGHLHSIDLFILPSRYESQGLAAMEAMSASVPVIASRVGGVPGIIEDGETGKLFAPGNQKELAQSIGTLLKDDSERDRLAKKGALHAQKAFSIDRMVLEYERLYDRV